MRPTSVFVSVAGNDRPGVTAVIFAALAAHDVDVRDVEQTVSRDRASLSILVDLRGDPAHLRHSVSSTADAFGVQSKVDVVDGKSPAPAFTHRAPRPRPGRSHAVVMSRQLRAGSIGDVAKRITDVGGNIESIWLSASKPMASVEMYLDGDAVRLRRSLIAAAGDTGLEIAVEPAQQRPPERRLLVLDADATLAGDVSAAHFAPSVLKFVRTVKRSGCRVAAVATARRAAADTLADDLELDAAAAVHDRAGKAAAFERLAAAFEVPLPQAVAVGDARRSERLLVSAGLAVGVDATAARHVATHQDGHEAFLDSVLFVMDLARPRR